MTHKQIITLIRREELLAYRHAEYVTEAAKAPTALERYWAGSATASIAGDVRAGRVVTVNAK